MRRSDESILTTHCGSLPRPDELQAVLDALEAGSHVTPEQLEGELARAVRHIVDRQVELGLAVVNDGEMGKGSYVSQISQVLTGFEGPGRVPCAQDVQEFPDFERNGLSPYRQALRACTGPISYRGADALRRDIGNLKAATENKPVTEVFMTAASPGAIALFHENRYYPSDELYLAALAEAMRIEYRMIYSAGFVLQVDCPDLAMAHHIGGGIALPEDFRRRAELAVTALNHALSGLPPSRMRMHVCWGNYAGPHHCDAPLTEVLPSLLRARPAGLSFPAANPRHEHEWNVWEAHPLPSAKLLLPGVIDPTTRYIEHPDLVAQRILRFTRHVGKNSVIASVDCGFASCTATDHLPAGVVWAKLATLVRGAEIANEELMPIRPRSRRPPSPSLAPPAPARPSCPSLTPVSLDAQVALGSAGAGAVAPSRAIGGPPRHPSDPAQRAQGPAGAFVRPPEREE